MDAPTQGGSPYHQPVALPVRKGGGRFAPLYGGADHTASPSSATHQAHTRFRLAVLFSVPLIFSLLFFCVTIFDEHTDSGLLGIQQLSAAVQQLRAVANDIDTGERSYLLTGEERFLTQFETARASLPSQIEVCRRYARTQPEDVQRGLARAVSALEKRTASAALLIGKTKDESYGDRVENVRAGEGEAEMAEIRQTLDKLQFGLSRSESGALAFQRNTDHFAFLLFLVSTALLGVVLYRLYHSSVSFLRDRDNALERFRLLNMSLEAQVEERTRDLRLANEELQQFAYVASHDLQEPLRTITSFSQLIESRYKGKLDADADEFIGYIVSSARRMTDLINGLLSLLRLRKVGQPTSRIPFIQILSDAEASLLSLVRETKTEITAGPLPELVVDRVQFAQVLQNLLQNAIKYRKDVSPRIDVSARKDESYWTFSVADNGRGFDPQFAERIFGLFQRLNSREPIEGTGLGLSIAKKIIERHGGRMWAESTEGAGSTFYFSLPVSLEGVRQE